MPFSVMEEALFLLEEIYHKNDFQKIPLKNELDIAFAAAK